MKLLIRYLIIVFISLGVSNKLYANNIPGSFADLADRLMPSVVNISTTTTITTKSNPFPFQFPPGSPFKDMFEGAPQEFLKSYLRLDLSSFELDLYIQIKKGNNAAHILFGH